MTTSVGPLHTRRETDINLPTFSRSRRALDHAAPAACCALPFGIASTEIHPHAYSEATAMEAAALQGKFSQTHELFHRQRALEDADLRRCAGDLGLDLESFDVDRGGAAVSRRIARDVESGTFSGEVRGTPTLFIDGVVHRGPRDWALLLEVPRRGSARARSGAVPAAVASR